MDYISYVFALLVMTGGVMGFLKAGSTMSLVAGASIGGLLAYGAWQMSQNPRNFLLSFGVSLFLFGVMGMRFYNSGKMMPAGLVAALSLGQVVRLGARFL
ncbi:transmembrane protein 14C-like [Halichondria panicea]|uniref:transmembrane protein 14C-like n=1 Tax=Halichondria panicea TaxID=6063 RepID=UPI00312BC2F6